MAYVNLCDFCKKNIANRQIKMNDKRMTMSGYMNWFGKYYDICEECYERMICFMTKEEDAWIKLYDKVPPISKDVELKIVRNGEEKIQVNKLIPMMDGSYKWSYCNYKDNEVIAWREI